MTRVASAWLLSLGLFAGMVAATPARAQYASSDPSTWIRFRLSGDTGATAWTAAGLADPAAVVGPIRTARGRFGLGLRIGAGGVERS